MDLFISKYYKDNCLVMAHNVIQKTIKETQDRHFDFQSENLSVSEFINKRWDKWQNHKTQFCANLTNSSAKWPLLSLFQQKYHIT